MSSTELKTFVDFEIRISASAPGIYRVEAQTPGSGVAESLLDWESLSGEEFTSLLTRIRQEPFSVDTTQFRAVGETLFAALFGGSVRDHFISVYSQRILPDPQAYMRIRINISEAAAEVATLPWEYLVYQDSFLAIQNKTLLTRHFLNIDIGPIQSLQIVGKPRVLVVIPRGSGLATEAEEKTIRTALTKAEIPFDVLRGRVSIQTLADTLAATRYHILHFIGHGEFRSADDGSLHGFLRFNVGWDEGNEERDEEWVADEYLRVLLGDHPTIKLVILNACQGAELAGRSDGHGFVGLAPALLKARVPAVIAMQYSVRDDVALQFAETFYRRLTEPSPWAGHVDIALTQARQACYLSFPNDRGYATPILYLRSISGQIFLVPPSQVQGASPAANGRQAGKNGSCPEPAKPDMMVLIRYRYDDAVDLARAVEAARRDVGNLRGELMSWRHKQADEPHGTVAIRVDGKIVQIETQLEDTRRELDELSDVLAWKCHEMCLQIQASHHEIARLQAEREHRLERGLPIPHSLLGELARQDQARIKLEVRYERARAALP